MITAVLFDLHGVVTSSPWAALAEAGAGGDHSQDRVLEVMLGDYAADSDHPWHRLERGEISLPEYGGAVLALAAEEGVPLDFGRLRGFNDRIAVHESVVDRIRSLRAAGLRTALVTNNVKELAAGWRELVPADELFNVVVDSSAVGVRKPNPEIFRIALRELGVASPDEAVFLDDAPGNVAGARAAGLHAIEVPEGGVEQALAELDALLAATTD